MSDKMVEVTVAPRRSIWENGDKGRPGKLRGPGTKVLVPEWDLERLHKQGFIRDPHVKKLTDTEIDATLIDEDNLAKAYGLNKQGEEGETTITESTDQKIERLRNVQTKSRG